MRGLRLFEKPVGVFSTVPALGITGTLPNYEQGLSYEGRLDIVNSIGTCTVELLDNNLPPGSTVRVDQATKEIVIEWPAFSPPAPRTTLQNSDFQEQNLTGWIDKRGRSWGVENSIDLNAPSGPPNWATNGDYVAVMRGVGRGSHVLESIKYPAIPGTPLMARSLWDQGPSNKDNNNLWTALVFYDAAGVETEVRGDRIHDRTNKSRHWSTVNTNTPGSAVTQAVRLIAERRNQRNRWIAADSVEVSGFYFDTGVSNGDDFYLTVRVRDSANRFATWTGIITWRSFFVTSTPYSVVAPDERVMFGPSTIDELVQKESIIEKDAPSVSAGFGAVVTTFAIVNAEPPVVDAPVNWSAQLVSFVQKEAPQNSPAAPVNWSAVLSTFTQIEQPTNSPAAPVNWSAQLTGFTQV